MRTFLTIVVVLLVTAGAFAYVRDPEDCRQIGHDFVDLYKSITPIHLNVQLGTPAAPNPVAAATVASAPAPAPSALVPVPLPTSALQAWKPPAALPQQPDWTWTTTNGKTYHGVKIVKVEADAVTILHADGGSRVPVSTLPADLQKQLNYDPEAAQQAAAIRQRQDQQLAEERAAEDGQARANAALPAQSAGSPAALGIADSSQAKALVGASLVSADGADWNFPTRGPGIQYMAVYFSAHWCPPCRAFTPQLVQWYNGFKPKHPNFELFFVSSDHDEASMSEYMKTMAMPWPGVRYDERGMSGLNKYANTGIPDLVFINSSGKVLSDSFQGNEYLGPEHVVEDMDKQIGN